MSSSSGSAILGRILRLRRDLEWSVYSDGQGSNWVARDPISLEYFYCSDLERSLLLMMDGNRTLEQIASQSGHPAIGESWMLQWSSRIESAGLALANEDAATGRRVWKSRLHGRSLTNLQWILSPLSLRIKLLDPSRILHFLNPLAKILFSRAMLVCLCLLVPMVGYLVILDLLQAASWTAISNAASQFSGSQVLVVLAIFVLIKSAHELGHALACQRWNAECHELGVLLMALVPCLYCDTSDSWKLTRRLHRAWIAAAGIYVEVVLSTIAACVWLVTQPDTWLHWAAAYTMLLGTFSTIIINANPLLRYDGYYILSDIWKVPNLSEQSQEVLRAIKLAFLTGERIPRGKWDSSIWALALYGLASVTYRTFVMLIVLGVVWVTLDKIGLRILGVVVLSLTAATMLVSLLTNFRAAAKEVRFSGRLRILRAFALVTLFAGAGWYILQRPWPVHVGARAITKFSALTPIYARQTAQLVDYHASARPVPVGSRLVSMRSTELELEQLQVQGQIQLLQQKLKQLRLSLVNDERAANEIGNTVEELAKQQSRSQLLKEQASSLIIMAEHPGIFIPSELQSASALTDGPDVGRWLPLLSESNLGCHFQRGTLLGWLAKTDQFELSAIVSEADAELLSPGMTVLCRWDCQPSKGYAGQILRIAPEPIETTPSSLQGDAGFLTTTNFSGQQIPKVRHYEVLIVVPHVPVGATHQALATAHIHIGQRSLHDTLYRFFTLNIRPKLIHQN